MKFDAVVIGGGMAGFEKACEFARSGKNTALISFGRTLDRVDYPAFSALGGTLMLGCKVREGLLDGSRVAGLRTDRLGDDIVTADEYVLATGKFFGHGIVADMDRIYEPVFGLDVKAEADRAAWFNEDFFAPQPFMGFGVMCDESGHPFKDGVAIENLLATGGVVAE